MRPANVSVHIEELVLHGVAPGDRQRAGEALQAELARLFAEEGAPPALLRSAAVARMVVGGAGAAGGASGARTAGAAGPAGAIAAAPSAHPESIGTHAARAIYGAWSTR